MTPAPLCWRDVVYRRRADNKSGRGDGNRRGDPLRYVHGMYTPCPFSVRFLRDLASDFTRRSISVQISVSAGQTAGYRCKPLLMDAQPGEILLPALPRLVVPDLLGSDGPSLDIHALPDLFVDELVDLGAEPTSDLLRFSGHLLQFGEVRQGVLSPSVPWSMRRQTSWPDALLCVPRGQDGAACPGALP